MTTSTPRRTRAHYPFVVEPFGDRWQILFVRTDTPRRVAEFLQREEAFSHMRALNRRWWLELHAWQEAQSVIEQVRGMPEPQPSSVGSASLWRRLRQFLLPR